MSNNHRRFYALLKQQHNYNARYRESIKAAFVRRYSNGFTASLSEFSASMPHEYDRMIQDMAATVAGRKQTDQERRNAQRRKLLAVIYNFCKHSRVACDTAKAVKIACKACAVERLNDAGEQKLIAAIKRFESSDGKAWANGVLKQITDEMNHGIIYN